MIGQALRPATADGTPSGVVFNWPVRVYWEDTDAALKYHRPARLDDQLLVTTWMQDAGRVCMTIGQQARRGPQADGPVLCDATIRIGWVDSLRFKPARIPSSIVKALS